jgi:hypothetical protein
MGRKFNRHQVLREKDPWEVARNAFDIALELALLGYVEEATELYNLFESFSSSCHSSWSPGLYFAWEATGLWPASIPTEKRTSDALSKLENERILWKRDTNATDEGLDKLIATATGTANTTDWAEESVIRPDDLTAAIDLALYMDNREKALEILQVFADNFDTTWLALSKSRQAWQYLKHQTLARTIQVDEDKLTAFKKEVYETFKERLEKGARRIYKDLPTTELVRMCNENTLRNAVWEEMDVDPDDPPESILHAGATDKEIADLQARLGVTLPDDFIEFLSATNGLESTWNGFSGEPKLRGTDSICVADASEQQEDWETAHVKIPFVSTLSVEPAWPKLDHVIQINDGSKLSNFIWLLEPALGQQIGAAFFAAFGQLPAEEQTHVKKMLEYFHAGRENADQIGWQVCVWSPPTLNVVTYHSWREYLEMLAGDTANEDVLDEEDDQGRLLHSEDIFAYQLR